MRTSEWRPGPRAATALTWSGWGVFVAALLGYGSLYLAGHDQDQPLRLQGSAGLLLGLLIQTLLVLLAAVAHELIHLVGYWAVGGRARLRLQRDRFLTMVEADLVSRPRYLLVAVAPLLVLGLAGVLAVRGETGGWWVVPAAANVSLSVIDVVTAALVARLPSGSLVGASAVGLCIVEPEPAPAEV